jgi:hypothetical protein
MAAPNLKAPTTILGRTARYAVTTSLANALANSAASGKVLKINSIFCANVDGTNAADISVSIYDGTTDLYIAKTIAVPADATQVLSTKETYFYLEEGDSIRALAVLPATLNWSSATRRSRDDWLQWWIDWEGSQHICFAKRPRCLDAAGAAQGKAVTFVAQ